MKLKCIMKRAFLFSILFTSINGFVVAYGADNTARNLMNGDITGRSSLNQQMTIYNQYAIQKQIQDYELSQLSRDPWRAINGGTNLARGEGWYEFQGEPQGLRDGGVIFLGSYGNLMAIRPAAGTGYLGNEYFFVENYPYPINPQIRGVAYLMAHHEGMYSYTTKQGQTIQIPKLNYGMPCAKIWSAEEIAAARKKITDQKQAAADKALKNNQDLADKGDPYGLLRMGERYRDGEGVSKDMIKAKMYFSKAADAGDSTAADELSKLNP